MNCGIIYSCAGRTTYLCDAIESAKSVRKYLPNAQICLFHNYDDNLLSSYEINVFTEIKKIKIPEVTDSRFKGQMSHFLTKLYSILETPYENTLFLDADTEVKKPIKSMFNLLKKFDIAIAPGPMTQPPVDSSDIINEVPKEFPELNTGVILYRMTEKMRKFLTEWKNVFLHNTNGLFRRHGKGGEQVSLRYLLWNTENIRMHIFSIQGTPNMFNYRYKPESKQFSFKNKVVIHHNRERLK